MKTLQYSLTSMMVRVVEDTDFSLFKVWTTTSEILTCCPIPISEAARSRHSDTLHFPVSSLMVTLFTFVSLPFTETVLVISSFKDN